MSNQFIINIFCIELECLMRCINCYWNWIYGCSSSFEFFFTFRNIKITYIISTNIPWIKATYIILSLVRIWSFMTFLKCLNEKSIIPPLHSLFQYFPEQSTKCCSLNNESLPVFPKHLPSKTPVKEKVQHDPQCPWSLT